MAFAEPVVTELTIDARGSEQGQAQYVRAMASAQAAMERTLAVNARLWESNDKQAEATQQVAAANDNLSRSYGDVSNTAQQAGKSFLDVGSQVLTTAGHLKFAALAAYALSPALRAMVNPAVVGTLAALGPAAVSVGATIVSALTPAFAFLARLAVPILAIVVAWQALSAVVTLGSGLLEKYGNAQRNLIANVDDNLKKLTRFQDDGLSADQVQRATELGARLIEAKRTISEFSKVQFDLTNPALALQAAWVRIVESIAAAVNKLNSMPQWAVSMMLGAAAGAATGAAVGSVVPVIGTGVGAAAGVAAGAAAGLVTHLTSDENSTSASKAVSQADALTAAYGRLAAGMGSTSNFAVRFGNAINDLQNPTKAAAAAATETRDAWDRYADQVAKATAGINANTQSVGLGAAEHERLKVQLQGEAVLERDGVKDTDKRREALKKLADAAGAAAEALERALISSQIKFDAGAAFLSDGDRQIAQQLRGLYGNDIPAALASSEAQAMRFNNAMREMSSAGQQAGVTFANAMAQGKSGAEAALAAVQQLSSAMLNVGTKSLMGSLTSGLSGNGFNFDPASLGLGALGGVISYFTGQQAQAKQREAAAAAEAQHLKEQAEAAMAAWQQIKDAAFAWRDLMTGGGAGTLKASLESQRSERDKFIDTFYATLSAGPGGRAPRAQQQTIIELTGAYSKFVDRTIADFNRLFEGQKQAFASGLGADSPFLQAADQIKKLGESAIAFVEDVRTATTPFDIAGNATGITGSVLVGGASDSASRIAAAQAAAQQYVLALLAGVEPLTDAQKAVLELNGKATQLQGTLQLLGLSSADAASKIADNLNVALDKLRSKFADDLTRQINDASGKGFLNDFSDLFDKITKARADAAALGTSDSLIDRFFGVQAQKIVDGAGLVGSSFDDLIQQFPQLTGVIHESTAAIKAAQDAINANAKGIVDYVNGLFAGANSTLSPGAQFSAAQASFGAKLGLAQTGNADAQSSITSDADNLLKAARAMFGSAAGYQNVFNQVTSQLLSLPAVQQTDDPVTIAMRNVVTAIQAGNAAQLTLSQVSGLGLSRDVTLGTLLTQSQLSQLGLASNGTVAGLLTAAQLAQQNLATNPSIVDLNTRVGTLLTQPQLHAAGLAANTTVAGLLTAAQLAQQGLARDVSMIPMVGIETATEGTRDYTGTTVSQLNTSIQELRNAVAVSQSSAGLLTSIRDLNIDLKTLNGTAATQLALLTGQFIQLPSSAYLNKTADPLKDANIPAKNLVVSNNILDALNKIVINTWSMIHQLQGWQFQGTGGGVFNGTYASGGWITGGIPGMDSVRLGSGGLGMPGEFVVPRDIARANASALEALRQTGRWPGDTPNVVPFPVRSGGGMDTGALLAELRELRREVTEFRKENSKVTWESAEGVARAVVSAAKESDEVSQDEGAKMRVEVRQASRGNRVA